MSRQTSLSAQEDNEDVTLVPTFVPASPSASENGSPRSEYEYELPTREDASPGVAESVMEPVAPAEPIEFRLSALFDSAAPSPKMDSTSILDSSDSLVKSSASGSFNQTVDSLYSNASLSLITLQSSPTIPLVTRSTLRKPYLLTNNHPDMHFNSSDSCLQFFFFS